MRIISEVILKCIRMPKINGEGRFLRISKHIKIHNYFNHSVPRSVKATQTNQGQMAGLETGKLGEAALCKHFLRAQLSEKYHEVGVIMYEMILL